MKRIIFNSFPDYSDNSYALFKSIKNLNNAEKYECIWLINKRDKKKYQMIKEKNSNVKVFYKKSVPGIFYYFISDLSFSTHGLYVELKKMMRGKKINLWHGMPLKNIGLLDGGENKHYQKNMIATSNVFQEKICQCFGMKKEEVFITGQPRNDLLFEKTKFYEKLKISLENYKKVIMYLPTYRKSIIGETRSDGNYREDKLGIVKIEEINKLNNNLLKNNNLMIVKLHPMDVLQEKKFEKFSNIIILKTEDLERIDEQLYPLLGSTDLLITDYSSVWVDYEILGKPIYFAMDDYEEYKTNRGFTIENLPELLPGDIIQDFETLLKKLENIPDKIQKETGDIFNKYKDNKSCERVLKALGIL